MYITSLYRFSGGTTTKVQMLLGILFKTLKRIVNTLLMIAEKKVFSSITLFLPIDKKN